MKNNDLRAEMVKNGLFVYQVAAAMNIKCNTLSHYLMQDLSEHRKNRIRAAIVKAKELNNGQKEKNL